MAMNEDDAVTVWPTEEDPRLVVRLVGGGSQGGIWRVEDANTDELVAMITKGRPEGQFSGSVKLAPSSVEALISYYLYGDQFDNLDSHVQAVWDIWGRE